jgi:ethanolamine utilization protein EutS
MGETKLRVIQEQVPGRQVTLAHVIANPDPAVLDSLRSQTGSPAHAGALGIMSLTPSEISVVAADLAAKSASVRLDSMDVGSGTLFFSGTVSEVESALKGILDCLKSALNFETCGITRT